ncbi:SitI6 family double-CXXCG motif immunity protein [Myxococcus fulvus]|uniref:SitI6 family double-CXXCG motif immunity protein n=1 Tax=Myxococcus fulvus TaxID=33 RepID=UPI0020BFE6BE|nr:double-CXXCG motif protein [Myxococcus fulvus]
MMRHYLLRSVHDRAATAVRWDISAKRRWGLPGTECPACEAGGGTLGLTYPSVDLAPLPEEREYRRARSVPWDEYVRLRDRILPLMPPLAVVEPGIDLGPLEGSVRGHPSLIAMDETRNLFVQPEGAERLLAAGLRGIKPEPTALKVQRGAPPLLELELVVSGGYSADCQPERVGAPCPVCGTQRWGLLPYYWGLDPESVPDADVFRFWHHPGRIIVSEHFAEVLHGMGNTGLQVTELPVRRPSEAGAPP